VPRRAGGGGEKKRPKRPGEWRAEGVRGGPGQAAEVSVTGRRQVDGAGAAVGPAVEASRELKLIPGPRGAEARGAAEELN
jgi:hypothetical protein